MKNVIFVHGIGVRQPAYDNSFDKVRKNLVDRLGQGNVNVHKCYWGGIEGAKLFANGASIPDYDTTRAIEESVPDEEYELTLWELLYQDPFYELRLYAAQQHTTEEATPGQKSPGETVLEKLEQLQATNLEKILNEAELKEVFDDAKRSVISMSEVRAVASKIPQGEVSFFGEVLARATVAKAISLCGEESGLCEASINSTVRDGLVDQINQEIGEQTRALGINWTKKQIEGLALNKVTNHIKRKRGAITDSYHAAPGDVLLYQARGQAIRNFIASQIEAVSKPVVVIGHSLGGVASVDLLIERDMNVDLLITVGSQAPLFYELNALQSLPFNKNGPQLPPHFPKKWWNFYDKRDFLSYVGKKIFGNNIVDVEVDNKEPFPKSHLAYWSKDNEAMWKPIVEVLKRL